MSKRLTERKLALWLKQAEDSLNKTNNIYNELCELYTTVKGRDLNIIQELKPEVKFVSDNLSVLCETISKNHLKKIGEANSYEW